MNFLLIIWALLFSQAGVDEIPQFKGGRRAMESFISEHLVYPVYSRQNCIEGTIEVSFRLGRDGRVVDPKVQRGFGIDLDEEALRIVRLSSGKWAVPASFDTASAITIPISFSIRDPQCGTRSANDIKNAIAAYRAQEELTGAITNYYAKKQQGTPNPADEQKIQELKEQLGYDEEFVERLLDQARRKLKQKDKEGACQDLQFIKKIGSTKADKLIEENCK